MFSNNIRNIGCVHTYAGAKAFFERTPLPTWRKKKIWEDNERPLHGKYQHHYRVVKVEQGYELHLYNQIMARFHHPDADGNELRQYSYHSSMTSTQFMHHVLKVTWAQPFQTTTGDVALVPIRGGLNDTELLFDNRNRLIVERSSHMQLYRAVSTDEDKMLNKAVRELFKPFVTVCMFRLPEYLANFSYDYNKAIPFGDGAGVTHSERSKMLDFFNCPDSDAARDIAINTLIHDSAQKAYDSIMSKRIHARLGWKSRALTTAQHVEILTDNNELVTEQELAKALLARMVRTIGKRVSGKEIIPKFCKPGDFPYSNNFY
jgi:hypothetical protein